MLYLLHTLHRVKTLSLVSVEILVLTHYCSVLLSLMTSYDSIRHYIYDMTVLGQSYDRVKSLSVLILKNLFLTCSLALYYDLSHLSSGITNMTCYINLITHTSISSIKILVNTHFVFCVIISHAMLRQIITSGITYMSLWRRVHDISTLSVEILFFTLHYKLSYQFITTLFKDIWSYVQHLTWLSVLSHGVKYLPISRSHVSVSVLQATIQFMTESDIMYSIWHGYARVK